MLYLIRIESILSQLSENRLRDFSLTGGTRCERLPKERQGAARLGIDSVSCGMRDSFLKFGSFSVAGLAKPLSSLGYSSGPLRRNQRVRPHRHTPVECARACNQYEELLLS
jgi:hypothetical protein